MTTSLPASLLVDPSISVVDSYTATTNKVTTLSGLEVATSVTDGKKAANGITNSDSTTTAGSMSTVSASSSYLAASASQDSGSSSQHFNSDPNKKFAWLFSSLFVVTFLVGSL